jgi:hypothetical protein
MKTYVRKTINNEVAVEDRHKNNLENDKVVRVHLSETVICKCSQLNKAPRS